MFRDLHYVFESLTKDYWQVASYKKDLDEYNADVADACENGVRIHKDSTIDALERLDRITLDRLKTFEAAIRTLDSKAEQLLRTAGLVSFGSTTIWNWNPSNTHASQPLFAVSIALMLSSGVLCLIALAPRARPTEPTCSDELRRIADHDPRTILHMTIRGRDCHAEAFSILSKWKAASVRLAYMAIVAAMSVLLASISIPNP